MGVPTLIHMDIFSPVCIGMFHVIPNSLQVYGREFGSLNHGVWMLITLKAHGTIWPLDFETAHRAGELAPWLRVDSPKQKP